MSGNVPATAFFFERSETGLREGEGRLAEAEREAIVHIIDVLERDAQQCPELHVDLRVDGAADTAAAASDRSGIRPMRTADGAAVKGGAGSSGANALTRRESLLLLE